MNIGLLKDKVKKSGLSGREIAQALSIDESTYYRKLSGKNKTFTVEEAQKLVGLLKLTNKDASQIFLT